uniref:Uncharacterized protein n=1 Tax=Parascaris equorum TaxID=6256 RepID=A0A914R7X2_PAREQ
LQLLKIESATFKEETARAHAAVKAFAVRVDSELAKMEINRRWDRIRSRMDRSSVGRINQNDLFTCSVIALNTLMVRDMPRNTSVFLVVDLKPCFDLFVVTFSTKSHLQEWKRAIEA